MQMSEALSKIRTQLGEENLTNSCGIRNCRVDGTGIPNDTTCVPIVFHGNGNHQAQFRKLRREKINFDGKRFPISRDKCNAPKNLLRVLNRAKVLPQLDK